LDEPVVGLHLLDGPYVTVGPQRRDVPEGGKRLVVLMAIRRRLSRCAVAEALWPDVAPRRAAGNLRSAWWRLRCAGIDVLCERDGMLGVDPDVRVDLDVLGAQARRLASGYRGHDDLAALPRAIDALDLLPGWYDDWVCDERERLRAAMLDLIDAISVQLCRAGRWAEAIDAALVAVGVDPLRASSHSALVAAHVGEGNLAEAYDADERHRRVLHTEFDVDSPPHPLLRGMLALRPVAGSVRGGGPDGRVTPRLRTGRRPAR
jgi:DNA-binding SARP family transcriptional activator